MGMSILHGQPDVDCGSLARRRLNLTNAAQNLHTFADADQAETTVPFTLAGILVVKTDPIVFDRATDALPLARKSHLHRERARMFRRVRESFLNDSVESRLDLLRTTPVLRAFYGDPQSSSPGNNAGQIV